MKRAVHPTSREDLLREYPIEKSEAPGWYFREHEVSNGHYVAEGRDSYGHSVGRTGPSPLKDCIADAIEIAKRIQTENRTHE